MKQYAVINQYKKGDSYAELVTTNLEKAIKEARDLQRDNEREKVKARIILVPLDEYLEGNYDEIDYTGGDEDDET